MEIGNKDVRERMGGVDITGSTTGRADKTNVRRSPQLERTSEMRVKTGRTLRTYQSNDPRQSKK